MADADGLEPGRAVALIPSRLRRRPVHRLEAVAGLLRRHARAAARRQRRCGVLGRRDCFGIYEPTTFGMEFAPQKTAHLALHVDDIAAARAELEAKGVEFDGETFDTGVCHMAFFHDPDGNALMLHHRYKPREGLVIKVERADFVSVPVTDMERSKRVLRRDARPRAGLGQRRAGRSTSSARTSRLYLVDPTNIGQDVRRPAHRRRSPCACRMSRRHSAALEAKGVEFDGEHVRHGCLPHGDLPRPGRKRAHAPPEVRTA